HSSLVQLGEQPIVGDVQDQLGGVVVGDSVHDRQRHLVVPAGDQVGLVPFEAAGRLPVGGHVGGLPVGSGVLPQGVGLVRRQVGGDRVEPGLLPLQVDAAGGLSSGLRRKRLPLVVVVVQV